MKLEDFNQIDPKNMGSLPLPMKAIILAFLLVIVVGTGFWFLWQPAYQELQDAQKKEAELRETFMTKKKEAVNLDAYKAHMQEIERVFGVLLRQLPNKAQMDALLTDINQAGLNRGLEFDLFKPGQDRPAEFYAQMPISIRVVGTYHQIGGFATDISKLSRIVAFGDFSIAPAGKEGKEGKDARLAMDVTTNTFRYLDPSEAANMKKADKGGKKKKGKAESKKANG